MNRPTPVFPERFFLCVGSAVTLLLLLTGAAVNVAGSAFVCLAGYRFATIRTASGGIPRMFINYAAVWCLYSGSTMVIDALDRPDYGGTLLAWDRQLFGESPAISLQSWAPVWMNEILSAAYLSYLVYLHWVLWHVTHLPPAQRKHYNRPIFTALGLGFSLYVVVPASSIRVAFSDLFSQDVEGFWLTSVVEFLVAYVAARYDSFPSVHVLVTGVLLSCDFVHHRRRFWVMLLPSLVMVVSTILLRMHYLVDVVASMVILIPFVWFFVVRKPQ